MPLSEATKAVVLEGLRRLRINVEMSDLDRSHEARELAAIDLAIIEVKAASAASAAGEWRPISPGLSFKSPNSVHLVTVGVDCLDIEEYYIHTMIALPSFVRLCEYIGSQEGRDAATNPA